MQEKLKKQKSKGRKRKSNLHKKDLEADGEAYTPDWRIQRTN